MKSVRYLIALVPLLLCMALPAAESKEKEVKDEIDPGAEKALKAAGFTDIHGIWKMPKPNIFEVTDGSLASAKTDGTLSFTIQTGAKGTLDAYCRNNFEAKEYVLPTSNNLTTRLTSVTGFGVEWDPRKMLVYGPVQIGTSAKPSFIPAKPSDLIVHPEEKTQINISVHDIVLKIEINGKTAKSGNYKIPKDGPFLVKIKGTLTLESPSLKD